MVGEDKGSESNNSKKRSRKEVYVFGNYRNYYGYRDGPDRLKVMKREWFEGKDCLDIGCNSGMITIDIAKKFGCRSILGIDIDGARIEDAHWTLRKVMKTSANQTANNLDNGGAHLLTEVSRECCGAQAKDLSKIVSFQKGNFVQNWHSPANTSYHVILCLSVSKWIHLNWGDDGLITLFWKVWTLLQPGGIFILEPQPWSSYHSNRQVSEIARTNYKNIKIPPQDFQDVLLDKIGFRRVENLTPSLSGTKSGFDRPILAFWK